jgi:DNA-binding transcriptional LysR family regulator
LEAGARFLDAIGPALATLADAYEAIEDAAERPRGTLRVCLSRTAYTLLIAPNLARFARAYPEICLELGLDDGLSDIVGERFDVGIRLGERLAQDMIAVPVGGPQRLVIVGLPAYFSDPPRPRNAQDLLEHDCIRLRFVSSGRIFRWSIESLLSPIILGEPPALPGRHPKFDISGNLRSRSRSRKTRRCRSTTNVSRSTR